MINLWLVIVFVIGFIMGNSIYRLIHWYYQWNLKKREVTLQKMRNSSFYLVEVINAVGFCVLYLNLGYSKELVGGALLFSILLGISLIDIDTHTIPDLVSLSSLLLLLLYRVFFQQISYSNMLYGFLLNGLLFILLVLVSKGAMGGGDIRLAALIGTFLGWQGGLLSVVLAFLIGSLGGIIILLLRKGHAKTAIPFGPFLSLGGFLSYLYGSKFIEYLN